MTTQLNNCKSVDFYVDTIMTTAHKLNQIGFKVNDEWVGTLLLAGLPDEYRPMIMGLESSGVPITGDSIKVNLLQDIKVQEEVRSVNNDTVLLSKRHNVKIKSSGPPKCYNCNKIGHLANKCWNKGKNKSNFKPNEKSLLTFLTSNDKDLNSKSDWFLDSCASTHITNNSSDMTDIVPKTDVKITTVDNSELISESIGTVPIQVTTGKETLNVKVKEVLYVPDAATNLLSVSKIVQKGHVVTFDKDGGKIKDLKGEIIATASEVNGIYKLDNNVTYLSNECSNDSHLWHRRLGHLNRKSMGQLKNMSTGLEKDFSITSDPCEMCVMGKHARQPFKISKRRTKGVLELIHTDLCGPMETTSIGGSKYFLTFIDDYSRNIFVYFLTSKHSERAS